MTTKSNNNGTGFKISAKKRALADLLCDPECKMSITDMCYAVGIARSTYYSWLESDEYREYLESVIRRYTDGELPNVWKALVKKASHGNVEAIKLFFEMKGKYRQEIDISGGVVFVSGESDIRD